MERLVLLRKQRKITQDTLAKELGISRQAYSNYELGNREPDFDTLKKLATFFDVSIDYLVGNSDNPNDASSYNDIKVALFGGDGEVTDEMWNEVKQFADFVRAKYKKEKQ